MPSPLSSPPVPWPLPPCLLEAGATLATASGSHGDAPDHPPGLTVWARPSPTACCSPAALAAAWRATAGGLVAHALGQPVRGLLTPVRVPDGDHGAASLLFRSAPAASMSDRAVASWRAAAGGEEEGAAAPLLPPTPALADAIARSAWASLSVTVTKTGNGSAAAAVFSVRAAGRAAPGRTTAPLPSPLLPACPARPTAGQRVLGGGAAAGTALEVTVAWPPGTHHSRACAVLQAPAPFLRLAAVEAAACDGGGAPPAAAVRPEACTITRRRARDEPDTATVCFDLVGEGAVKEDDGGCVRVVAGLARLAPLAGAGTGLVSDPHARSPVPAALVVWRGARGGRPHALTFASSADPAGVRPAVVDETIADVVGAVTAVGWLVFAAAMLQAAAGAGRRWKASGVAR